MAIVPPKSGFNNFKKSHKSLFVLVKTVRTKKQGKGSNPFTFHSEGKHFETENTKTVLRNFLVPLLHETKRSGPM